MIQRVILDASQAARRLLRAPKFTAFCVLTIGLSVGIGTAVYAVIHATLYRPSALPNVDRLVNIYGTDPREGGSLSSVALSWVDWQALSEQQRSFTGIAAYGPMLYPVLVGDDVRWAWGEGVTEDYFEVVGAYPRGGRMLLPADHDSGAIPTVVISERLWTTLLGRSSDAIGRLIRIRGTDLQIVGIMQPSFRGAFNGELIPTDFWVPARVGAQLGSRSLDDPRDRWLLVRGLLAKPDEFSKASSEVTQIAARLDRVHPPPTHNPFERRSWIAIPTKDIRFNGQDVRFFKPLARAVLIGMAILLFVAAINLSNLVLARQGARAHERAVKVSLGAPRGRLVSEQLIENGLLAFLGGVVAVPIAVAGMAAFRTQLRISSETTIQLDPRLNMPVFIVAILATIVVALIVTTVPAFRAGKIGPRQSLSETSQSVTLRRGGRRYLIMLQVMASVFFLSIALNCAVTAVEIQKQQVGSLEELAIVRLTPKGSTPDIKAASRMHELLAENGLTNVAITSGIPGLIAGTRGQMRSQSGTADVETFGVKGPLFELLDMPLLRGRTAAAQLDCVVTDSIAMQLWGTIDAIGRDVLLQRSGRVPTNCHVSGIVKKARIGRQAEGFVFVPLEQNVRRDLVVVGRSMEPAVFARSIASASRITAEDFGIASVQSGIEALGPQTLAVRIATMLTLLLGTVSFVLALSGIYGVMSQIAIARTREIGVRVALGGSVRQVTRGIVKEGLQPVAGGMILGLVFALLLLNAMRATFADEGIHVAAILTLQSAVLCFALAACVIPVRRATRIPVAVTLRNL